MLEPCDGKLSRTVLRGEGSREAPALPGLEGSVGYLKFDNRYNRGYTYSISKK